MGSRPRSVSNAFFSRMLSFSSKFALQPVLQRPEEANIRIEQMIHRLRVFAEQAVALEIRPGNVVEITAADLRTEVDVARGFLDGLESDALVLDELHRHLRNSPDDDVRAGDLRDGIVAVLRQPLGIKSLSALVIEDVLETVILQKRDGIFEFLRNGRSSPLTIG